jgi:hypothetical protein
MGDDLHLFNGYTYTCTVRNKAGVQTLCRVFFCEDEARAWCDWYRDDGLNATYTARRL